MSEQKYDLHTLQVAQTQIKRVQSKSLIRGTYIDSAGNMCAIGAIGVGLAHHGETLTLADIVKYGKSSLIHTTHVSCEYPELDYDTLRKIENISETSDAHDFDYSPSKKRYKAVMAWLKKQIKRATPAKRK